MSDIWKKWEGQVADHKYQLQRYLGGTDHSVVFLAEFHDPDPRLTAIKFISADVASREHQIAAWKKASELSHPNLIEIYGAGLCKIEDTELLYVAMEYAEENLSQVLPHRALMAEEIKEMLESAVNVLVYLHGQNLTHGHVKPSNVLAIGDLLKLSSDTILPSGEAREMRRERSAYDAPELPSSDYTPAADVWSLGVTLVEAATQQPAVLPFNEQADPVIPPAVRDPFLEIARHSLQREPRLRWTTAQILERLNPAAAARSVAAGAGASARSAVASASTAATATPVAAPVPPVLSPLTVPLSNEPAIPLAKQAQVPPVRAAIGRPRVRQERAASRETIVLPNYAIPVFAGLLVLIALILLPFVLRHRSGSEASNSRSSVSASSTSLPATRAGSNAGNAAATPKPPAAKTPEPTATIPVRPEPVSPAPSDSSTKVSTSKPGNSGSPGRGEALDQVMPEASAKALATIQGTVRVMVNIQVDSAGNVSEATLGTPGPSRYFSDLSLKAARRWVFTPPESNGRSASSSWVIQFNFTQAGVKAVADQVQP